MESDRFYFARRAQEERSAAGKAKNQNVRDAHRQIAECYERKAHEPVREQVV